MWRIVVPNERTENESKGGLFGRLINNKLVFLFYLSIFIVVFDDFANAAYKTDEIRFIFIYVTRLRHSQIIALRHIQIDRSIDKNNTLFV